MSISRFSFDFILILITLGSLFSNSFSQGNNNEFLPPPAGYDSYKSTIAHGKVTTVTYHSTTVGVDRQTLIYTPPDYSEDTKYNVLYLLHGIITAARIIFLITYMPTKNSSQ